LPPPPPPGGSATGLWMGGSFLDNKLVYHDSSAVIGITVREFVSMH
jgi:hypothetical protein